MLLSDTKHQINEHLNDCGRHRPRVSQLSQLQTARVGQKNLMKSMLSQLSHLSQSKNTDPEARDPPEALQNLQIVAIGLPRVPPTLVPSGGISHAGAVWLEKKLAAVFRIRLTRFINRAVTVHFSQ